MRHLLREHEDTGGLLLDEAVDALLVEVIELAVGDRAVGGQIGIQPETCFHVACEQNARLRLRITSLNNKIGRMLLKYVRS